MYTEIHNADDGYPAKALQSAYSYLIFCKLLGLRHQTHLFALLTCAKLILR